jgi:hypothetical protein
MLAATASMLVAAPLSAQLPAVPKALDAELANKLAKGETLEGRVDGDLNGDGQIDTAFIGRGNDSRTLYVALAVREETFVDHDLIGRGPLDAYPLGPAELAIARGVLTVKDLVGGTSATAATYRLRYEPATKQMRLIGLDTNFYSRTWAHDGRETSWNLLTGDRSTRVLKLEAPGGPYIPGATVKAKLATKPVYIDKLPDIERVTS